MGVLEYWSNGVLKDWSVGVLECWSVGVLEFWSSRVSYKHMLQVVGFELRVKKLNTQHSMRTKHSLGRSQLHHFITRILQNSSAQPSSTPSIHHSITPILHYSITPALQYSSANTPTPISPSLQYSTTPILQSFSPVALLWRLYD
jgi:hypothetical protein